MISLQKNDIGFMQGRLSPLVKGRIQAFPLKHWKSEFRIAEKIGIKKIEWTIDDEGFYENPLLSKKGRKKIKELLIKHQIKLNSITADCLMQAPFWKMSGKQKICYEKKFIDLTLSCAEMGLSVLVVPLVDNGSLENRSQEKALFEFINSKEHLFLQNKIHIAFESDYNPKKLLSFIKQFNQQCVGINYDIGNSASLGYDPKEEIGTYGEFILNVHVKDRLLGGKTVPLGTGNADFTSVFKGLKNNHYQGNLILQTARDPLGNHSELLEHFKIKLEKWIK